MEFIEMGHLFEGGVYILSVQPGICTKITKIS